MNSQFSLSLSDKTVQSLIKVSESEDQSEEKGKMTSVFCYLCDDVFVDEDSLRIHVENCGKIFHCAKCNGNFKSKRNLEEHSVFVHNEKDQYKFTQCQIGGVTKNSDLKQQNGGKQISFDTKIW